MRYLIRTVNRGLPPSTQAIIEVKKKLAPLALPRHVNFRITRQAVEFDLYEDDEGKARSDSIAISEALGPVITLKNLSVPERGRSLNGSVELALRLYSEDRFWEVHEELEGQWKKHKRGTPEKEVLQGLILLAAAYVHKQRGEEDVAFSVLRRAATHLGNFPRSVYVGLDIGVLRTRIDAALSKGLVEYVPLEKRR
jgi:hypothetical protein